MKDLAADDRRAAFHAVASPVLAIPE